jgi:hypothetical protein
MNVLELLALRNAQLARKPIREYRIAGGTLGIWKETVHRKRTLLRINHRRPSLIPVFAIKDTTGNEPTVATDFRKPETILMDQPGGDVPSPVGARDELAWRLSEAFTAQIVGERVDAESKTWAVNLELNAIRQLGGHVRRGPFKGRCRPT